MLRKLATDIIGRGFSISTSFCRIRDFQPIVEPEWNPPKRIFLVRHAEHEGNVDETLFYEKTDSSMVLTERGVQQCEETGQSIHDYICGDGGEDESLTWFVSPYKRCLQTFELLSVPFGGPEVQNIIEEPRLREQEWGNLQDPSWSIKMRERYEIGRFYYRFPNGESGSDVYDRVSAFMESSLFREFKKKDCADNIMLISHGTTLRMFLTRYYRWTMEQFQTLWNFRELEYVVMERFGEGANCYYLIVNEAYDLEDLDYLNANDKRHFASSFVKWPEDWMSDFDIRDKKE